MAENMENNLNRDGQSHQHFYQKDYSKLETIFEKAVERSRQKKIIHYASDRLYTNKDRKRMAQESFKPVSGAKPLLEKDIKTEILDLETPPETNEEADEKENKLFELFSDTSTLAQESTLTSSQALEAYEALLDMSSEEIDESEIAPDESIENEAITTSDNLKKRYEEESLDELLFSRREEHVQDTSLEAIEEYPQEETVDEEEPESQIEEEPVITEIETDVSEDLVEETEPVVLEEPEESIQTPVQESERTFAETRNQNLNQVEPESAYETIEEEPVENDVDNSILDFESITQRIPETPEFEEEPIEEQPIVQSRENVIERTPRTPSTRFDNERTREFFEDDIDEDRDKIVPGTGSIEELQKDVMMSRLVLIAAVVFLGIYIFIFYAGFAGYDYIALALTLIGFCLGFVLSARSLIATCIAMLAVLIGCMIYTISRTSEGILFYHYLWFLFIPISMSSAYAYIHSVRKLNEVENERELEGTRNNNLLDDYEDLSLDEEDYSREEDYSPEEADKAPKPSSTQAPLLEREPVEEENPSDENLLDSPNSQELEYDVFSSASQSDQLDFDGDADFYDVSIFEEEEPEKTVEVELSDTYENSFDWSGLLNEEERTDNTSIIDDMGEDALLSDFVKKAKTSDTNNIDLFSEVDPSSESVSFKNIAPDLKGEDEESISISKEDDTFFYDD